ncbi:ABC transporter permease [Demequina activiva]|uniref:ABC transporter permease n=1 Tax=Demequina activiva TaxID=1582364 RepID=A0A919Q4I7_9MICO|nr:ABC transporter permease [Demequina activiva]GIG55424.1 ABC transporter permease [Demequina activiva]
MSAAITSELRKLRSTRLWWVLLISMAVGVAFITGSIAFSFAFADELGGTSATGEPVMMDPLETARTVYSLPVSFGYVFPVILGALAVTSEFRHRTIDTTLLLAPSRARVIAAKFIAVLPFALLYGVVGMASGVAVGAGALMLGGEPTGLDSVEVWQMLGMSVVALTVWGVVGVGFGSALTNQVVVIVVLLGWTQLVEPIVRVALAFIEPVAGAAKFLPGAAGEAMAGASFYTSVGAGDLLSPWAGFAVLLGYAAIAGVIGWLVTFRRDIA